MLRALLVALCLAAAPVLAQGEAAEVKIIVADSTAGEMMAQAYKQNLGVNRVGEDGYEKVEQVGDMIVRESFQKADNVGSLTALVKERSTVEVRTRGLPASALREWLERVETGVLVAAKPDEESKVIPHDELSKALPEAPEGWSSSDPEEVTSSGGGITLSQATRIYEKK